MDKASSNNRFKHTKREPHFRIVTLAIYLAFILLFNLIIAPSFGLVNKVYASNIDTDRLVTLANQDRAQNGNLPSLTVDQRLVAAANNKAIDMFKKQYWAHYGPNGETPWQFIIAAGYNYTYAGENLAKDFTDTDAINTAWMNSSSHKANILNSNYQNIGIAAVSGKQICNGMYPGFSDNTLSSCINTVIVVQMFGTAVSSNSSTPTPTIKPTQTPVATTKPVSTPIVTPTSKVPSAPVITDPKDGSYLNTNNVDIKGNADNGNSIHIYEGETMIGTVLSEGGAFDFRSQNLTDGAHLIKAKAISSDGKLESPFSSNINFNIITIKPEFNVSDVKVQLNDKGSNDYYVEGFFSDNVVKVQVTAGNNNLSLEHKDGNMFVGIVKVEQGILAITVTAFDKAENQTSKQILLPELPTNFLSTDIGSTSSTSSSNIKINTGTKQLINITIGLLILAVFLADSLIVIFNGRKLSKSHPLSKQINHISKGSVLHHIIPVVAVIMAISISFTGSIL